MPDNNMVIAFEEPEVNARLAKILHREGVKFSRQMYVRDGVDTPAQVVAIILESVVIASVISAIGKIAVAKIKQSRSKLVLPNGTTITAKNTKELLKILNEVERRKKSKK